MEIIEIKHLLKAYFSDIIFPKNDCVFCEKPIKVNNFTPKLNRNFSIPNICSSCKEQLAIPESPHCKICHKPMGDIIPKADLICGDCINSEPDIDIYNRSSMMYNDFMKEMVALYKYRGKESLTDVFGAFLAIAYDKYYSDKHIDYLTFVPIHPNREGVRGFNQSKLLAQKLEKYSGINAIETLTKNKDTDKQSKHSKQERIKQIEGSFTLKANEKTIRDKNILIIDDIYTTGSTIRECSSVLKKGGANSVYSLTLARA